MVGCRHTMRWGVFATETAMTQSTIAQLPVTQGGEIRRQVLQAGRNRPWQKQLLSQGRLGRALGLIASMRRIRCIRSGTNTVLNPHQPVIEHCIS